MEKKQLRKQVISLREQMSYEEIEEKSNIIFKKIINMKEFQDAKAIMVYVSFEKEINTHEFIKHCLKVGKKLITPICNNKTRTLILGKTETFPEGFDRTKFGILELNPNKVETANPEDIDLIIMPGLAFTEDGDRLGYGAGYYDRLLSSISDTTVTIAPVFQEFIYESIPTESHDKKVDIVVTEK